MPEMSIYICENTDCVLDAMEQMTYALNETQVRYGSVVVLLRMLLSSFYM